METDSHTQIPLLTRLWHQPVPFSIHLSLPLKANFCLSSSFSQGSFPDCLSIPSPALAPSPLRAPLPQHLGIAQIRLVALVKPRAS